MELYKNREWLYNQRIDRDKSYRLIAEENHHAVKTITDWCKKFDIRKKEKWELLNESHGLYICEKYSKQSILLRDLKIEFNTTQFMIKKVLEFNGVEFKDIHEVATEVNKRGRFNQRTFSLDFDYFKTWTSNMAYILGFIYADGYVTKTGLRINLQYSDKEFLEIIKNELGYEGKVHEYEVITKGIAYKVCYLNITSLDFAWDLENIGLYPNKSLTIGMPLSLPEEFEMDFVRGYFDGDGCIEVKRQIHNTKNSDTIQLRTRICSGSIDLLTGIEKILTKNGLKKKKINKCKGRTLMDICYSTHESYILHKIFYSGSSMFLPRKKEKFEQGIALRSAI